MESRLNYTLIGLFVILLGIILVITPIWLVTGFSSKHYTTYAAYMNESVAGLTEQSVVKYNGVDVGVIKSINLVPDNPQQVEILMDIESHVPVKQDTTATLYTQGLTGIAYIGLKGGSPDAPPLKAGKDEDYPVIKTTPSLLLKLDTIVQNLSVSMAGISQDLRTLLNKQNQAALHNILQHLDKTSQTFADNSKNIDKMMQQMPVLITHLQQTSDALAKMADNVTKASLQLTPQLATEIQNLNTLTTQLNQISSNIKQNPAVLVRGQQPLPPGPGE